MKLKMFQILFIKEILIYQVGKRIFIKVICLNLDKKKSESFKKTQSKNTHLNDEDNNNYIEYIWYNRKINENFGFPGISLVNENLYLEELNKKKN